MGGQHTRIRQQVLLHLALGLILLAAGGCALIAEQQEERAAWRHLQRAEALQEAGRFGPAGEALRSALEAAPRAETADRILYRLGLLRLQRENPARSETKALEAFMTLQRRFPESPLAEPARQWIQVLRQLEQARRGRERLLARVEELERRLERITEESRALRDTFEAFKQIDLRSSSRRIAPEGAPRGETGNASSSRQPNWLRSAPAGSEPGGASVP